MVLCRLAAGVTKAGGQAAGVMKACGQPAGVM